MTTAVGNISAYNHSDILVAASPTQGSREIVCQDPPMGRYKDVENAILSRLEPYAGESSSSKDTIDLVKCLFSRFEGGFASVRHSIYTRSITFRKP